MFAFLLLLLFKAQQENTELRAQLERSYFSTNFGCLNRTGCEVQGTRLIKQERRRCASGELVLICADIGGMGTANKLYGEVEVNSRVRKSLEEIAQMRGIELLLIGQLNSGDEFLFAVNRSDADGVINRMRKLITDAGFSGLYASTIEIQPDLSWIDNANNGMKRIYDQKSSSCRIAAPAPVINA